MKEQIIELKISLKGLIEWSWILNKTCESEEEYMEKKLIKRLMKFVLNCFS